MPDQGSDDLFSSLEIEAEEAEPIFFNEGSSLPLLFSSPHSGRVYPSEFLQQSRLSTYDLQRMEDRFVDDLLSELPHMGISLLKALFPRSFCDVNRGWREIDGKMFSPPLDEKELLRTPRVMAGYGVIPRCTAPGRSIYSHILPVETVQHRLNNYWAPFHRKLHKMLDDFRKKAGYAILFDVHSMPSLPHMHHCDIVLGNYHQRACSYSLMNYVQQFFEQQGYKVQLNNPYAGGFITEYYGNPEAHIHVLQIELSRSLYLNEATLVPNHDYSNFKNTLTLFAQKSAEWVSDNSIKLCF